MGILSDLTTLMAEKERKILKTLFLLLLLLLAVISVSYLLFGHQLIREAYEGKSIPILSQLLPDRADKPVEHHLAKIDQIFWYQLVLGLPLTFLSLILIYRLLQFLFRKIAFEESRLVDTAESLIKHDLLIAALSYLACTLIFFFPTLSTLSTHLLGPPEDNMQFIWTLWSGSRAIFEGGGSLAFVNSLYYPEGASFYYHSWSLYNLLAYYPLEQVFGRAAAYNILVLQTFFLAGLGAFLLAKYLIRNSYLALLAGFIFAFNPNHFAQSLHHLNIASIQFIPFFVLYFIRAIRGRAKMDVILAAMFFLLTSLADWNYMIFAGYFLLLSYVYLAIRRRRLILKDVLWKSAIVAGTTILLLSPWLVPMIRIGFKHPEAAGPGHNYYVADLVGLFTPGFTQPAGGIEIIKTINSTFTGTAWETTAYLGLGVLILSINASRRALPQIAKYLLGLLSFLIFSFGAHLHVLGKVSPIIFPYRVIAHLPLFGSVRAPSRNIVYVYLFLSLIVALAFKQLYHLIGPGIWKKVVIVLVPCVLFFDYFAVCCEKTEVSLPPCYSAIPKGDEKFGILDLPSGYLQVDRYMMYQTMHHLPIVQGWASRKLGTSLIDHLEMSDLAAQKRQLQDHAVKYIVMHKSFLPSKSIDLEQYWQTYTSVYEDQLTILFQVY